MNYRVIESFLCSKGGDSDGGFDRIILDEAFVAVIDGATSKSPVGVPDPLDGGDVSDAIASSFLGLSCDVSASRWAAIANSAIEDERTRRLLGGPYPDFESLAAATVCVFSVARQEVWRIGDVSYSVDGEPRPPHSPVDSVAAPLRALVLEAHLLLGRSVESLRTQDVGRDVILPALEVARLLRNRRGSEFGFGALDGHSDPSPFLEVEALGPVGANEIVLATDGYVGGINTLRSAEQTLASRLEEDPLLIQQPPKTKGRPLDGASFDDRAYVRISIDHTDREPRSS